jgi:uncharacterized protein (TIGR02147 family)
MDVFAYIDYRRFLGDYYRTKKAQSQGFSYRSFARRAGLRSSNHLKRVIEGQRNLSARSVGQYARAIGLDGEPAEYFAALVAFNQSETGRDRETAYARMLSFRGYCQAHHIDARYAAYHSQWFIPVVREMALRRDFEADPKWIADRLLPTIDPQEAAEALEVLFELGMLRRTETGHVVQAEPVVTTGEQTRGIQIGHYHRAMLGRAADAIDLVRADDRFITSLTFCVGEQGFEKVRDRVQRFRKELIALLAEEEDGETVLQLGIQLFPVSVKDPRTVS